jgi:hypothetical protein
MNITNVSPLILALCHIVSYSYVCIENGRDTYLKELQLKQSMDPAEAGVMWRKTQEKYKI